MVEMTRTIRQWLLTARRLDGRDPRYPDAAERVRGAILARRDALPDSRITVAFTMEEAAVVLARAPLSAWWMPMPPVRTLSAVDPAHAEAEAIIRAIGQAAGRELQPEAAPDWPGGTGGAPSPVQV